MAVYQVPTRQGILSGDGDFVGSGTGGMDTCGTCLPAMMDASDQPRFTRLRIALAVIFCFLASREAVNCSPVVGSWNMSVSLLLLFCVRLSAQRTFPGAYS